MTRIRHRELAAFSKGLDTLYGAIDMASLPDRVTRCLDGLFDCELSTFDLIDLSAVHWSTLVVSPIPPSWDEFLATLQRCAHAHPIVSHAARHDYQHAIRISDLFSLRQYRQTALYQELCVPYANRMDRQLGFVAKPSATLAFGVSVNRRGRDFSAEQRTLMEMLRPHLQRAYSLAKDHLQTHARELSLREEVAVAAGGGLCQIGPDGKVEWMTAEVEPLLVRYFSSWVASSNRLPAALLTILRSALAPARKHPEASLVLGQTWSFPRAGGTLRVRLAARTASGQWQLLLTEEPRDPSAETLAKRHGLSRREAETLWWIGHGKTNEEIGLILAISTRIVQKHVQHLFEKLGVYNRTAAARVAMGR